MKQTYEYDFSDGAGAFQSWFKGNGTVVLPKDGKIWKTDSTDNIIFFNKNGVVEPEDCPYVLEYTTTDGLPIGNTWGSDVISTFNESGKVLFARPCERILLSECLALNTLILPNGLTEIYFGNFGSCSSLTSVIIPNSVSFISEGGFVGCSLLSDISYLGSVEECRQALTGELYTVPALYIQCSDGRFPLALEYLYTTIDGNPIYPANYKTSEYINNLGVLYTAKLSTLDPFAFAGQTTLQSIILPDYLEVISQGAFSGCSSLESVTLGTNLKEIGAEAFNECSSLTEITIPENVQAISENVFYRCSNLTSVVWNAINVTQIPGVGYNGSNYYTQVFEADKITSFTFGNNVTVIPLGMCAGMKKLTSITIPNSVTSIELYAFDSCDALTSITIPNSVTSIGNHAFSGCSSLTSITIPNSVTSIGYSAFTHCSSLTSLTIPNSVTSIGNGAFDYCTGLTSIVVEEGNTIYDSRENCNAIIETATNTLIIGCQNTIIPNSVTSIGVYAFYGCESLTSITIPESVTSIGDGAFRFCHGLTSITIPESVTSIGDGAFYDCSGLTSITCEAITPPTLGSSNDLSNVQAVYVPAESVDAYKTATNWSYYTDIIQAIP